MALSYDFIQRPFRAALAALILSVLPGLAWAEITLTFGTYAADKPTETVRKYKPFLDFLAAGLSERLGEPVTIRIKIAPSYGEGIAQLANGEVDFARFGPASYVLVQDQNPDIAIIAMESKGGAKRFNGIIAVHADSPYQSLSDLSGQSFAFGSELSTIGRYLAQASLLEAGISSSDLESYEFLGRHDLVGEAVGSGRFAAGALKESTFNKLVAKGVPLRALYTFENVTKPWLSHPNMRADVAEAIRAIMLASETEEVVRQIAKHGFLAGADSDYALVRAGMQRSLAF
ncbi:PhnD/SsuA/transferrin family substrate-binding protein [Aliiroseovarius sp.]|uniref:PhnD/SsuA/transferrin family substrate-binding protein n=1 Tax=Aliiroseovarius sp. TaxID=1872442 RepID=UPI003BAA9988